MLIVTNHTTELKPQNMFQSLSDRFRQEDDYLVFETGVKVLTRWYGVGEQPLLYSLNQSFQIIKIFYTYRYFKQRYIKCFVQCFIITKMIGVQLLFIKFTVSDLKRITISNNLS